ncbi:MAG: acyl-CoA reductase [Vicingaceae bacterium]
MELQRKVRVLSRLGDFFDSLTQKSDCDWEESLKDHIEKGREVIQKAKHQNAWFTPEAVKMAISAWATSLNEKEIEAWLKSYDFAAKPKIVGVIMAGNIPLVGLHDALAVIVCGHELRAKLSSKDQMLMQFVLETLALLDEEFDKQIQIVERLNDIDYLIATGSDNSARYFDYYFKNKRKLLRKNRTSVALLDGTETKEQLNGLAADVFTYFGLGCRNITKVYLPEGFDKDLLFGAFFAYKHYAEHNAYANNYDYNKAVYLLNSIELLENGFLLLKEDEGLHSPVGVLFYEEYDSFEQVEKDLEAKQEQIQCIVSNQEKHFDYGEAQKPKLWDYADGVDTLAFLLEN